MKSAMEVLGSSKHQRSESCNPSFDDRSIVECKLFNLQSPFASASNRYFGSNIRIFLDLEVLLAIRHLTMDASFARELDTSFGNADASSLIRTSRLGVVEIAASKATLEVEDASRSGVLWTRRFLHAINPLSSSRQARHSTPQASPPPFAQ